MSDSPESVVRKFLAAWADPKADELANFFADDAVGSTVHKACVVERTRSSTNSSSSL